MEKQKKRLIKAFQKVLSKHQFDCPQSFSEDFAIKRFQKKFQKPDRTVQKQLALKAWSEWIDHDRTLPNHGDFFHEVFQKNPTFWSQVRELIKTKLKPFQATNSVDFTSGSTYTPMEGKNSVEAKLCSTPWDCTYDNFERFSVLCYRNAALKKAFRHRWKTFCRRHDVSQREYDHRLYHALRLSGERSNIAFLCFQKKLAQVVTFVEGSRFATVPKNNKVRRPINVEPLCNILTQKQIGTDLRMQIKRIFKVDLDTLAIKHHSRISDLSIATIDLKNASDSFSQELIRFLMPRHYVKHLMEARSSFIETPDGDDFLYVEKISAMGNGFTFELMTFLLTCICRTLDPNATVFGDDIIITKDRALELMSLLQDIGLQVNREKSFIDGPFRESCGGNYHGSEGYIKSFDFLYPTNLNECIIIYNKVKYLSDYPSFKRLERELFRHIPPAWRGAPASFNPTAKVDLETKVGSVNNFTTRSKDINLDGFFRTGLTSDYNELVPKKVKRLIRKKLRGLCLPGEFNLVYGVASAPKLRSSTVANLHPKQWAKYLMYLSAGRRCKDVIVGKVLWSDILFVICDQRAFRLSNLINS